MWDLWVQFSSTRVDFTRQVPGSNLPGSNYTDGKISRKWQFFGDKSSRSNLLGSNSPESNSPGGNVPGANLLWGLGRIHYRAFKPGGIFLGANFEVGLFCKGCNSPCTPLLLTSIQALRDIYIRASSGITYEHQVVLTFCSLNRSGIKHI